MHCQGKTHNRILGSRSSMQVRRGFGYWTEVVRTAALHHIVLTTYVQ